MLRSLKTRLQPSRKDEGFTLIELMVVVLIIAILLGIAIPTFLGAQNKAKDRSAQSSLRNTLTAAKTVFSDTGSYVGVDKVTLLAVEPSLAFVDATTASSGPKEVSVQGGPQSYQFYAAAKSATGTCFYISDTVGSSGPGTQFAKSDTAACTAGTAAGGSLTFQPSW